MTFDHLALIVREILLAVCDSDGDSQVLSTKLTVLSIRDVYQNSAHFSVAIVTCPSLKFCMQPETMLHKML